MKLNFGITVIVIASVILPSCTAAGSKATSIPPSPTLTAAGTVLWTFETGGPVWSSPAVSNGLVYFGSDDKTVYALDAASHALRWKFITGGIVRSRPAVAGSLVYVSSDDGVLHVLDGVTGAEKWNADLGSAKMPARRELGSGYDYQQSSPVVADGVVYVGSGAGEVDAFDALTGRRIWQFLTSTRVRSSPAIADGMVFIGDGNGYLHALDAKSGIELWKTLGCDNPTPAVDKGLVFCGSRGSLQERAWNAQTGSPRWQFSMGHSWVESSAKITDGMLYVGSSDASTLYALESVMGNWKWSYRLVGYAWCSPAVSNGTVYIGAYASGADADFYAVNAATGELRWKIPIKNGVVSSPVVADGVVYFGGMDGSLYAVRASNG